jgi:hypothetical protein
MIELLELLLTTLGSVFRSRKRLILENLLLCQQLQVALRCQRRPRLRSRDKLFWLLIRRLHWDRRCYLLLVRPETVPRWHRKGWRLFWQWQSHHPLMRPRLKSEVRALIATMAHENPKESSEPEVVEHSRRTLGALNDECPKCEPCPCLLARRGNGTAADVVPVGPWTGARDRALVLGRPAFPRLG